MADREQADVLDDILQSVEEEDDADQEQQVVISGHHVLCAQIEERNNGGARIRFNERGVALRHVVRACAAWQQQREHHERGDRDRHALPVDRHR